MRWFVITVACEDCGYDPELVGPFESEAEAEGAEKGALRDRGSCAKAFLIPDAAPGKRWKAWGQRSYVDEAYGITRVVWFPAGVGPTDRRSWVRMPWLDGQSHQ